MAIQAEGAESTGESQQGTFRGDENVLNLVLGGGYAFVCESQTSSNT